MSNGERTTKPVNGMWMPPPESDPPDEVLPEVLLLPGPPVPGAGDALGEAPGREPTGGIDGVGVAIGTEGNATGLGVREGRCTGGRLGDGTAGGVTVTVGRAGTLGSGEGDGRLKFGRPAVPWLAAAGAP